MDTAQEAQNTMMTVDMDELRVTAELAHIAFSEEELEKALASFQEMLSFFSVMRTAKAAEGDAATFRDAPERNAPDLRPDTSRTTPVPPEAILAAAGERDGQFIVIPNVR
jgi:Asp-tRNA(Asn)/Glu-tRNA(Gln) amidotransferase C subunit